MRRSLVLGLALLLLVGVGIAVVRVRSDDKPEARPTPTPTASATTTSPTPSPTLSVKPTPVGPGPRDREYDVVLASGVTANDGAFAIAQAGGEIVRDEAKVGVFTVMGPRNFVARARKDKRIYGVVTNPAVGRPPAAPESRGFSSAPGQAPRGNSGSDPLNDLQWDMSLIKAPEARRTESGDNRVLVAVIDTGVDRTHPDLVKAYDRTLSRNFTVDHPGADGPCEEKNCTDPVGTDPDGHGTHVAGTIVAAADGFGMVGIAPGVRLVDLRAGQDSGLFFLLPTVKALVYAGDIGVDVANMSYFVDPWLYNCPASPDDDSDERYEQQALIEGVRRAVNYAHGKGVTLIAAAGNEHDDLDTVRTDEISPDFPDGAARLRRVDPKVCHVLPTTLDHVIEVSALARDGIKADYSDYGLSHIAVTAPGGSGRTANGAAGVAGYQTLSSFPERLLRSAGEVNSNGRSRTAQVVAYCRGGTCGYYRYLTGTSMASPHVAGVAALIVSKYGTADPAHPGQLRMDPAEVERILTESATEKPCPSPATVTYAGRPADYRATCRGTRAQNSFYGAGLLNALAAVSR